MGHLTQEFEWFQVTRNKRDAAHSASLDFEVSAAVLAADRMLIQLVAGSQIVSTGHGAEVITLYVTPVRKLLYFFS